MFFEVQYHWGFFTKAHPKIVHILRACNERFRGQDHDHGRLWRRRRREEGADQAQVVVRASRAALDIFNVHTLCGTQGGKSQLTDERRGGRSTP